MVKELERRKRRLRILGYDDLLTRLAKALEAQDSPARDRMRRRWRIVLVDEFQDTDPIQWQVLECAFSEHSTLILIGDPKQAIYGFRGGDIHTYLRAARTADARYTLGVNWRSDKVLVDSLQTVLGGAALGHPEIVVHDIDAHHDGHRLAGAPHNAPFGCASSNAPASATTTPTTSRSTGCAATFPPIWPPTSPRCWPAAPPTTAGRFGPGTSR